MTNIFSLIEGLAKSLNVKPKNYSIDNKVFKLHYRVTVWMLVIAAGVIWSNDFYADRIQCSHSRAEDEMNTHKHIDHVMNSWCYYMGLFTVPRHHIKNESRANMEVHYAGVGPIIRDEPTRKLSWYQWVGYALIVQAICFYIPHIIWRIKEQRVMYTILKGYKLLNFHEDPEQVISDVNKNMFHRLKHYSPWAVWLFICEGLNLVNLVVQWFLTDWFLQGNFSNLGYALTEDKSDPNQFSRVDVAFPKMAKCTLHDFGHTGEVQTSDLLCVLTNNILYEKIYLILWVWYVTLMTLTAMALVHRLLSWLTYNTRMQYYNVTLYQSDGVLSVDNGDVRQVMDELSYTEWVFLQYLLSNLDVKTSGKLFAKVAETVRTQATQERYKNTAAYENIPPIVSSKGYTKL